jgi:putative hemolysin
MNMELLNWLIVAACVGPSFLLSGMEAGVFALNRLRVRRLARAGNPAAKLLHGFLENQERFLWTVVVGNTLVNFLILGLLVIHLEELFMGRRAWAITVFAVAVFLFYTLFDLLPKMLFRAHANQLCLAAANLFRPIHFVLSPLVLMMEDVSGVTLRWTGGKALTGRLFGNREEMLAVMQESSQALTTEERAMIKQVLSLQNFTVRQLATPLAQTVTVQKETPVADALAQARARKLFRLPVWEMRDDRPRIAGLLSLGPLLFRDGLDLSKPAAAYMTPALFLNEDTRLEDALRRMQRAGERLAIVLARDGREMGVVSLEDILKLMFGEVKL